MRRLFRIFLPLASAAIVLLPSAPLGASEVDAVGWWWRAQTGLVAVPAPPNVPEGGLAVGTAPDGATAVGAVRFVLDDEAPVRLTLTVADSQGTPELLACPPTVRWAPAQAGRWPSRPAPACDLAEVEGAPSEDGATWTFDVAAFPAEQRLDLVIVPIGDPAAFQISFEPPEATALETRSTAAPPPPPPTPTPGGAPGGSTGGAQQPQPEPQPQPNPQPAPRPAPAPVPGSAISPPTAPSTQPQPQAPVVAPAAPTTPGGQVPAQQQPVAVSQEELDERDREGAMTAAAALVVMTGMVAWSTRRRVPDADAETSAGLGRFTAPRTGPPPPLI